MKHRIAASLATVLALAGGGVAVASAAGSPAQSAQAKEVASGPFHLSFNATRPAGAPSNQASGVFDAQVLVGATKLMHLQGPVTCLDVRGNSVGLFYPVTGAEPAAFGKLVRGVYIYMHVDGRGQATGVAFSPSIRPWASTCAPIPGVAPASGYAIAG